MANLLWGNVYYQDRFAGVLRQEPGERMSFTYDEHYLAGRHPSIAHTLPLRTDTIVSQSGLPPFFDNLVAEGWLEEAQTRLLGKRRVSRFELLLAFGQDCAGAVSVIDPDPEHRDAARPDDPMDLAVLSGRASLSGIQPKLALVRRDGQFRPARTDELSTHIAKFPSPRHGDLTANEYLTTQALQAFLPGDEIVDLRMGHVAGFEEPTLIITRFDRTNGGQRIHFEEFNQLLGNPSHAKYEGSHKSMADFIRQTPGCLPAEVYRLYLRILAGILLGNTDMHLKNFAMFHTEAGLRLTPAYDAVSATLYGYNTIALSICGSAHIPISEVKARTLIRLGEEFGLSKPAMAMAAGHLEKRREAARNAIAESTTGTPELRDAIITFMEKRWNGTFALIGKSLSKKP
ncbi:MAG: HipA domain-containing protein [Nitrospira sp.]|nr:HipA domain-containing protein [Nitrospira sp.]